MPFAFTKMHGAGNDFIFLDGLSVPLPDDVSAFARRVCHRRFGVGADQLLIVLKSPAHDFRMDIYNADGGRVEMCGNGVRCFAKYVRDKKLSNKDEIRVETLAGVIVPKIIPDHPGSTPATAWIEVDMGVPVLDAEKIPTRGHGKLVSAPLDIDPNLLPQGFPAAITFTAVSMGNPHAVVFVTGLSDYPVAKIGPVIENHPFFPNRTNVEFVEVVSSGHLVQRTWERGSGETYACGTGACAVCVAGVLNGVSGRKVKISLKGGDLDLRWDEASGRVFKTGPATTVFEGTIN